jgi:hypothetical protein
MKSRRKKVVEILRQEFGMVRPGTTNTFDKFERVAAMIVNVLEYKKRSRAENDYYWSVIIAMTSEYFGDDPQSMHDTWRSMFLTVKRPGMPDKIRRTSAEDFTTRDAERYYEQIRVYMAREHGFVIPLPGEKDYENNIRTI